VSRTIHKSAVCTILTIIYNFVFWILCR